MHTKKRTNYTHIHKYQLTYLSLTITSCYAMNLSYFLYLIYSLFKRDMVIHIDNRFVVKIVWYIPIYWWEARKNKVGRKNWKIFELYQMHLVTKKGKHIGVFVDVLTVSLIFTSSICVVIWQKEVLTRIHLHCSLCFLTLSDV